MLLYQCCALLNRNADNWPLFCLQPSCPVTPGGQASLTGDTPQVIANSPYPFFQTVVTKTQRHRKGLTANISYVKLFEDFPLVVSGLTNMEACWSDITCGGLFVFLGK